MRPRSLRHLVTTVLPNRYARLAHQTYRQIRQSPLIHAIKRSYYRGKSYYCPICHSSVRTFLPWYPPTPEGAPVLSAICPVCGSLERHRLLWLFLHEKTSLFAPPQKRLLHIAPESCLMFQFQKSQTIEYVTANLAPNAMVQTDLTQTGFADETFDVIYASHVLEHVQNDRQAMKEIFRILKVGGWAVLQVPLFGETTYEDPRIIDPKEREQAFGQHDHVRVYGQDYYQRLSDVGFVVRRERISAQTDPDQARVFGLVQNEEIPWCQKMCSATAAPGSWL